MIKRTESEWLVLFKAHQQSGLTAAGFCRKKNLCPQYFSLRRRQLSGVQASKKPKIKKQPFIKASIPPVAHRHAENITLRYGGSNLTLPSTADVTWLATLVKALT